jgi:hypothetical protein
MLKRSGGLRLSRFWRSQCYEAEVLLQATCRSLGLDTVIGPRSAGPDRWRKSGLGSGLSVHTLWRFTFMASAALSRRRSICKLSYIPQWDALAVFSDVMQCNSVGGSHSAPAPLCFSVCKPLQWTTLSFVSLPILNECICCPAVHCKAVHPVMHLH